jgi:hypothetical protein
MSTEPETEFVEPSHNMEGLYAVLAETNNQYKETWYYFIRYDTNIEALEFLYHQLESIEWVYLESYSTFSLDLENLVSPQTAKEMTKLSVNEGSYHRKFDGTLQFINFGFRKRDNNIVRLINICDTIGFGNIENFIDGEDFDPEDFVDEEEESEDESESESESSSSESDNQKGFTETKQVTRSKQVVRQNNSQDNNQKEKEEKSSSGDQSSSQSRNKKGDTNKSDLPTPPVPPPSPSITPSQESTSVKKKKSKKKN